MWYLEGYSSILRTHFRVNQYISPRFKTKLMHPSSFHIDDKSFAAEVCAKHSYGRNVQGIGTIKVTISAYKEAIPPVTKSEKVWIEIRLFTFLSYSFCFVFS